MIPVLLLTGFLGSGKTTLLNHLLGLPELAGQKLALIINEFGSLNIDARLVRDGDYRKYEINKGSIFCVCTKTAFIEAARAIAADPPDRVLVEATGVAETADIESFLREALPNTPLEIEACLAVIDCTQFITLAASMKTAVRQVVAADGLVLNKTDLAAPVLVEQVQQVAADLNPRAPQLLVQEARVPWSFIDRLEHRPPTRALCACGDQTLLAMTFQTDRVIARQLLSQWLQSQRGRILRVKGNVLLEDGPAFADLAAGRLQFGPPVPSLAGPTRLTVIAWKLERESLQAQWDTLVERSASGVL